MSPQRPSRRRARRICTTLDARLLATIRRIVGPRGVSRFLRQAAREHLARLELCTALRELASPPPRTTVRVPRTRITLRHRA
jgi:hypothetical protein